MARSRDHQSFPIAAASLAALLLAADAAQAQWGWFGDFFRGMRERVYPRYHPPALPYARALPELDDPDEPLPRRGDRLDPLPQIGGAGQAYCVRLCDGRYFPVSRATGTPGFSPAQTCAALCPAAQTKLFYGAGIEGAVAPDGERYANLENAFVYREQNVEGCTCNGRDRLGLARIEARSDPTLRPGDVIVTETGPAIFRGGRLPYQAGDFAPATDVRGLPKATRDQLSAIRVGPGSGRVILPAEPRQLAPAAAPPQPRAATPPPARTTPRPTRRYWPIDP